MKAFFYSIIGIFVIFCILFLIFSYNNITFEKLDNYYLISAEKDFLPNSAYESLSSLDGYHDKNGAFVMTNVRYAFTTHLDILLRVKGYVDIPSEYTTIREFYSLTENRSIILNTNYCEIISIVLAPKDTYNTGNYLYSSASFKYPSEVIFDISYKNNSNFVDVVTASVGNHTLVVPVNFAEIYESLTAVYNATQYFKPDMNDNATGIERIIDILDYYIIEYPSYIFMYIENYFNLLRG